MWYPETVTAAAASEPVTAAQVKQQCGIASSDTSYDDMITRMIASGRGFVEKYCAIRIVTQTVTIKCDGFADFARLPVTPVQSVSSIAYIDANGDSQTLDAAVYESRIDGMQASIVLKYNQTWPVLQTGSRITVTAVVGWASVPQEVVSAILLWIGRFFYYSKPDPMLKRDQVEGMGMQEWDTTGMIDKASETALNSLLENYRCWPLV